MDTAIHALRSSTISLFKKEEDNDGGVDFLTSIDKTTVLQDARAFNATPINPRKCRTILTRILWLLYHAENFNTREATDTFFSITKLFQCEDVSISIIHLSLLFFHYGL